MIVGILECWTNKLEWLEEHGDFADWFPPFLRKADPSLSFKIYHAHLGDIPAEPRECDAWLITGSGASVYENLPWQADLADFVCETRGVRPILGVCYGHQLLHCIYGGLVEKASGWGIGVHRYSVHDQIDGASELRLIASHQDQVTRAAVGTQLLASSDFCPIAATRIGEDIVTIQPHPEITLAQGRDAFTARRDEQGSETTDGALRSLKAPLDDVRVANWMVAFMRGFVMQDKKAA